MAPTLISFLRLSRVVEGRESLRGARSAGGDKRGRREKGKRARRRSQAKDVEVELSEGGGGGGGEGVKRRKERWSWCRAGRPGRFKLGIIINRGEGKLTLTIISADPVTDRTVRRACHTECGNARPGPDTYPGSAACSEAASER
eukprot:766110-Hanusia_phi.AAC.1